MSVGPRESLTQIKYGEFDGLRYTNGEIEIVVLPEMGAKIVSLKDLATNREWLSQAGLPIRRVEVLSDAFNKYDMSGWDECFPNLAAGLYFNVPWRGTPLWDHGEVWQRPWSWEQTSDGLATSICGLQLPYQFTRYLRLIGKNLEIIYRVRNLSEIPFVCMWSMHPLFDARPGMRMLLPRGCRMVVDSAQELVSVRYRERFEWPWFTSGAGNIQDLSVARVPADGFAMKLFSEKGQVRRAALSDPTVGAWLGVEMDPQAVPHLGMWLNEGRWPTGEGSFYHIALEPTTGCSDSLEISSNLGSGLCVKGHAVEEWRIVMVFGSVVNRAESFVGSGTSES